jgi:multidrug resistance protein
LSSVVGNLGGFALYAWVPSINLLTTAVTTPLYGKLADLFGRKRVLFVGIGLFLLGSVLSGAAPRMVLLILFRALQGLGAGAVMPVTTTIIGDIFTLEQRARVQGVFSSVWGVASVIGPLLGGLLVDNVGWRWIFYLNLPVGMLAVLLIGRFFHERAVPRRHTLDIAGASLLTGTLTAVLTRIPGRAAGCGPGPACAPFPPGRQRTRPCRARDRTDGNGGWSSAAHGPTGRATTGGVTHNSYSRVTHGWGSGPPSALRHEITRSNGE